jgi:cyclase
MSKTSITRRSLLGGASASLALANTQVLAAAASLQWQDIEPGLALVTGAGGNVLVVSGNEGVAMIDGGNAASADALLRLVRDKTGKAPSLLFNTHCHRDQIGCNATLGKAGARIIAHENTRLWLTTEIISKWEGAVYPPMPKDAWPNQTFWYDSEAVEFNGESIEYGWLSQAHTDGDIYVHFPQRNLIMAGGVVAVGSYPIVDYSTNGWIGGMISSLQLLLEMSDDNTRIIASEGHIVNKAHLQAQLDLCSDMATRLGEHYYRGGSYDEFLALAPTANFDERWGDPALFVHLAYEGTLPRVTDIRRYGIRR